jgi:hypothetical protein
MVRDVVVLIDEVKGTRQTLAQLGEVGSLLANSPNQGVHVAAIIALFEHTDVDVWRGRIATNRAAEEEDAPEAGAAVMKPGPPSSSHAARVRATASASSVTIASQR